MQVNIAQIRKIFISFLCYNLLLLLIFFVFGHTLPTLTQLKNEGIDPFYWKVTHTRGHWNHAGNKAVANTIAEDIYTKLLTINN